MIELGVLNQMAVGISEEENQQLQRTVEMFEAITESQPDDYQSLEILKEAYNKLGRKEDGLRISKQLARAYIKLGQVSQAILEFEGIVQEFPNDADATAALAELEKKTNQSPDSPSNVAPSLAEHSKAKPPPAGGPAGAPSPSLHRAKPEDGDRILANVLIVEKLLTTQAVEPLLQRLREIRHNHTDKSVALSLVPLLVSEQIAKLDDILMVMVNKSRLPFMPLSIYDVDRDTACRLPEDVCWQYCLVPFDLISRSVLIATANPFDQAARKQVEAMLDFHVFWFVAPPADIVTALRRAYGLDNRKGPPAKP
jgi:tetratricopeptide (TPR) repeat protein